MSSKSIKFPLQKIKNIFFHYPKSLFFSFYYGFPAKKLNLIGITGTDGKTTTCLLLYEILKKAGINTGVITTIGAKFGDNQEINTGFHTTSPDPSITQKILSQMLKAGVTHVICEVTAHALDQYRFNYCQFSSCVITNVSHEHLDYYSNIEKYTKSKARIFKQSRQCILNKDDPSFPLLKSLATIPIKTFSINEISDFQAKNIKLTNKKLEFNVNNLKISTDSNYYYQIYNILASLAVIHNLKIDPQFLISTVKKFPETKGRREEVQNKIKIKSIIDFAHTPAALENTLSSLKKTTPGNLIVIFGATGGRDSSKRPKMGEIVSKLANIAIITSDDTRNEDIQQINQQIISGIDPSNSQEIKIEKAKTSSQIKKIINLAQKKFTYFNIPNRQDAFNLAIKLAQKEDTVIACGKGHENTILHGKTEYPWSEQEAFRTAFRLKNTTH